MTCAITIQDHDMEHLRIHFRHDLQAIQPYCEFVERTRRRLADNGLGEYLGDDMAIDGGDAEALFACPDARALFAFLHEDLKALDFMAGATIQLIHGALASDAIVEESRLD